MALEIGFPFEVYPRVGGGNAVDPIFYFRVGGLSPRGRGKHVGPVLSGTSRGSIPAWAGETEVEAKEIGDDAVYPRVGGGNAECAAGGKGMDGLSPRGRGKHTTTAFPSQYTRSIPAWAGETVTYSVTPRSRPVYPRVGGGNV